MIYQLDVGELVSGYQVGRALRLADWRAGKEQDSFERLCNRLRVRLWRVRLFAEGGEKLAAYRAYKRDWAREHRDREVAAAQAKLRRRKTWPVITCGGCGNEFMQLRRAGGRPGRYCSNRCKRLVQRRRAGAQPFVPNAVRGACKHGHVLDQANTYTWKGTRYCRACRAAACKRAEERRR